MKYWAYINNEILGPYEKEKLFELPVFSATTLICPQTPVGEKTEDWKEASTYPEITAMLGSPPGGGTKQLTPEAGSPQPAAKSERPQPVFNTELPESKPKSLSPHPIDQTPPAAAHHIEGADFEVNQLGGGKAPRKKEEPQPAPSFTGADFDPMSLSQIGRRAEASGPDAPQQEPLKPADAEFTPPEILPSAPSPSPAPPPLAAGAMEHLEPMAQQIPAAEPPFSPAPGAAPVPVLETRPAGAKSLDEIDSKLETLAANSLTKRDIEPLKEKLGQMGEVLSSMKSDQFQREIMDKIQCLEKSLSDIKASLAHAPVPETVFSRAQAPAPAAASPQTASISVGAVSERTPFPGNFPAGGPRAEVSPASGPQTARETSLAPTEPKKPMEEAKQEVVDKGTSGRTSGKTGVIKKIFKFVITLILLAAAAGGAAFALKHFGVFDVTKVLPFPVPFLSAPKPAGTPEPFQAGQAPTTPQEAQQAPAPQAEPAKTDLSPEIIFIGRTFAATTGGPTLENKILENAAARKGDPNKAAWQSKELPNGMFELSAVIPLMDGKGQLSYNYEVDYARKTVKPLDDESAKPLDAILKENQAPRQAKAQMKKGRQGAGAASPGGKRPRPAAKRAGKRAGQAKEKPAAAAEDEYEYVYEDEAGTTEE